MAFVTMQMGAERSPQQNGECRTGSDGFVVFI